MISLAALGLRSHAGSGFVGSTLMWAAVLCGSMAHAAPPPRTIAERIVDAGQRPADAGKGLEEALRTLVSEAASVVEPQTPEPGSVSAYAAAYDLFLEGEFDAALIAGKRAHALSPGSAEPLELLALIEDAAGRPLAREMYYRMALERDPRSEGAVFAQSASALSRGENARALAILAPSLADAGAGLPAWKRSILLDRAARALVRMGYLDAAIEAARGIDAGSLASAPGRYRPVLIEVLRSHGALFEMLGDTAVSMGEPDRAVALYDEAERVSPAPRPLLDTHRAYALVEAGRIAEAEALVIGRIERLGAADAESRAILDYLLERGASRQRLGGAIGAVARSMADAEGARPGAVMRSAALLRLAATIQAEDRGVAVLTRHLAENPTDRGAAVQLLRAAAAIHGVGDAWARAVAIVEAEPRMAGSVADALLEAAGDPAALVELSGDAASPATRLLGGLVQWRLGRERGATRLLTEVAAEPALRGAGVAPAAELLLMLGRLGDAEALIDSIDETTGGEARLAKAEALARIGDPRRALAVLAPMLDETVDAGAAGLAGRLHRDLGEWRASAEWYARALSLDPVSDDAASALMRLVGPGGPLASEASAASLARAVREADPTSPVLGWMRARSHAAEGQADLAAHELRLLFDAAPSDLELAAAMGELLISGREFEEARAMTRALVDRRPGDGAARVLHAETLMATGGVDEAADTLEDWLKRFPGDARASRLLEYLMRAKLSLRLTADEYTEKRLARSVRTAEIILEDISLRISKQRMTEAMPLLDELRSAAPEPSPSMIAALRGSAEEALLRAASNSAIAKDAIALAQEISGRYLGASSAELLRLELHTWSKSDASLEQLIESVDRAERTRLLAPGEATMVLIDGLRNLERLPGQRPIQNQRQRLNQIELATAVLRHASTKGPAPTARLRAEWLQASASTGKPSELAVALEYLDAEGEFFQTLEELESIQRARFGDAANLAATLSRMADIVASEGLDRASEIAYEGVLYFDPEDQWACNNLGYRFLERGVSTARAVALIEIAYRKAPDEAAIVDSMGWARYVQGRLKDEVDPATGEVTPGAVTLLEKSLALASGDAESADPYNILMAKDHLGDALWAAGEKERAAALWADAAALAGEFVKFAEAQEAEWAAGELRSLIARNAEKARAVAEGGEPPIAPILGTGEGVDTIPPRDERGHGGADRGRT